LIFASNINILLFDTAYSWGWIIYAFCVSENRNYNCIIIFALEKNFGGFHSALHFPEYLSFSA
jgi:hypothetical protein